MTGRRGLLVALVGFGVGGGLVLLAAGRVWGRVALTAQAGAQVGVSTTGHDAVAALPALGFAVLLLAAAVVAARSWLRVVVGLVGAGLGGIVVALAVTSTDDVAAALQRRAFAVPAGEVHASLSGWAVIAAVGGVAAVLAGALTVARGRTWPGLGARYDSPGSTSPDSARAVEPAAAAWDALDRGEDPTE